MRKRLAVIALSLVLAPFAMGAEGCEEQRRRDHTPRNLPSQRWTNEPENKVGNAQHGAWCDGKEGQRSYTETGIPVVCKKNPGEDRPRWRNG